MRFHTVAASDEDIRGTRDAPGKSQVLRRADLDVLCDPHSWLTDALINYGVEECDAFGAPLTDLHNGVLWIRPAVVRAGVEGDFSATLGGALGWQGGPKPLLDTNVVLQSGANVVLFPVNQGDTHWSLVALYRGQNPEFVHYDSLQPANTAAATALVNRLRAEGFLSRNFVAGNEAAVPRQQDGYNCGSFVIQNARTIMALGAKPQAQDLQRITSLSSDEMRISMLLALVPLVAEIPPVVGEWWEHPSEPLGEGESRPVEQDSEARKAQLAKIHAALQKEAEVPIQLSSVQQCKLAEVAKVVVTLASSNDELHEMGGGSVTFTVEGEQFTRPASWDGKCWMTSLTTKFPKAVKVAVSGKPHPIAEFIDKQQSEPLFELGPGGNKDITLTFAPREPRRLHLKFVVQDDQENEGIEDETQKIRRPFPKDTQVEILLDDGSHKLPATIAADGTLTDPDGKPGVKIPYHFTGATPQFPDPKKKRYLAWTRDSENGSATVFLDDPEKASDTQQVGFCLPTGTWIPVRRPNDWTFAAAHQDSKKALVHNLELAKHAKAPDPEKPDEKIEPIEYILKSQPPPFLMNGHLIEHVVCLMLENRGFDHFMGFLYEGSVKPKHSYPAGSEAKGKHQGLRIFEGLEGMSPSCPYDYDYTTEHLENDGEDNAGNTIYKTVTVNHNIKGVAKMRKGAVSSNIPTTNPHEDFIHIFQDMYGKDVIKNPHDMEDKGKREAAVKSGSEYKVPSMDGWAQNFCDGIRHHRDEKRTILTNEMVDEIMQMYLPEQLPVMSGLARNYAVSDLWFCSVPSQTNTNRSFWASGHAAGICKNDFRPAIKYGYATDKLPEGNDSNGIPFRRSLFDVLDEHGHDWKYHWFTPYPPALRYQESWKEYKNYYYFTNMFPQFKDNPNVSSVDEFWDNAQNGTLPRVTYIEPYWGGGKKWDAFSPLDRAVGNEFHPVQDMFCGEFFVKQVYDAVVSGPKADTTLLIITFDENGGTYDHFPPWKATPPGRAEGLPKGEEYGFEFDCYGVRIPTLLISKYIKRETIFRSPTEVPLDHTSVISTVLEWLAIPKEEWRLGDRVAEAPSFAGALMGEGEEEADRRQVATGLGYFDEPRKKRISGQKPIQFGQQFVLKYIGNKWADNRLASDYLCDPTGWLTWYPTVTKVLAQAIKFAFAGGEGPVTAGSEVVIEATGKTISGGKSMKGYSLALETKTSSYIYLYSGSDFSLWIPWLVNDRNEGVELFYGDEIYLFSEQYQPKHTPEPFSGVSLWDPFKRLTVNPVDPRASGATRYATWRAGYWDIWVLERPW
jgi:phospholipase C